MGRTRWYTVLGTIVAVGAVSYVLLSMIEEVGSFPPVPWLVVPMLLALAVWLFVRGWKVRQYLAGKRPNLPGVQAARTVVFAKTAVITGAALTGWYGAIVAISLGGLMTQARASRALAGGGSAAASILFWVVGLIVEAYCNLPPTKTDEAESEAH